MEKTKGNHYGEACIWATAFSTDRKLMSLGFTGVHRDPKNLWGVQIKGNMEGAPKDPPGITYKL